MSDLETVKKENEELKKQAAQNSQGVHQLLAQLEAHKQSLNEALNVGLNLRTNFLLVQKQAQELSKALQDANKKVEDLAKELEVANAKIATFQQTGVDAPQAA